jgi:predicted dehydrogenase
VLGAIGYGAWAKKAEADAKRREILDEIGVSGEGPAIIDNAISNPPSERINLGIIGNGGEGEALLRGAGFLHPELLERWRADAREDPRNQRLADFMAQGDLNLALTAVCDLFDKRAERAIAISEQSDRPGGGQARPAVRHRRYTDLLEDPDVDAVIVATPDHWHSQITIDAASVGKHVYCEKAMTRVEEEVIPMVDAVKASGIKFQLGHQNRQLESHEKAREVIDRNVLGPITLVEVTTNRNSPWGAWVWDIEPEGNPDTIDWAQFQETAGTQVPFSLERFFRWRCWFDYGTGLAGDLFSHEYDAVNQILGCGIPSSCTASGGIYFFKDGRDVPDTFQAVFEYPDRDMTMVYSATLANGRQRGKVFMGHDATMEVGGNLRVYAEAESTRYEDMLEREIVDPDRPLLTYRPGFKGVDAVTTATEEYFASRGLLYTYQEGRRVSTHWLHIGEWLNCIRNGGEPSCNIDRGFEEAMTCHMATKSLQLGRKVEWDPVNRVIV